MANINQNRKFQRGEEVTAAKLNDISSTATVSNLQNTDFKSDAAIAGTKLDTISTAGKVNSTALVTTSAAAGDFLYSTGTAWARLPVGTAGQRLRVAHDTITGTCMTVAYDSGELAAAATSITITGLNGDTDEEYELICRFVGGSATPQHYYLQYNADTGSNYGTQRLDGLNTTAAADRTTPTMNYLTGFDETDQNNITFCQAKIQAKSGYLRTAISKTANNITGTTVNTILLQGHSWTNTADNLTSIIVSCNQADGLGIGSRVILLKKSATPTNKTWEEIYTTTLAAAATSLTIPSLTGNTDVLYRLRARVVSGYNGTSAYNLTINSDTATNYGWQWLHGANTTVTALRTPDSAMNYVSNTALGGIATVEYLIYAKSGFIRTCIMESTDAVTTTVGRVFLVGNVWNNSADEITQMVLTAAPQVDGIGIGSEFHLERLNL